jgi:hypothetical protein
MADDHDQAARRYREGRQPNQRRKRDHCPAQRPSDDEHRNVVIEIKLPAETAGHHPFEKDQPQAASEQKSR